MIDPLVALLKENAWFARFDEGANCPPVAEAALKVVCRDHELCQVERV